MPGDSTATLKMLLLGEDRGASRALRQVGNEADGLGEHMKGLVSGFGDVGAGMSSIMTKAGMVGPALMAAGAALSSAAAGGVALAGAIGPAAVAGVVAYGGALAAVKTGGLVAKFALDGISDAAGGNAAAMAKLTPAGQQLAKTLSALSPQVDKLRASVQRGLFPGAEDAVNRLARAYLPALNVAAGQTGRALGDLARDGGKMAATGPFRADFATLAKANATNIGLLGHAGLFLADAARSILVAAAPLTTMFSRWAVGAAQALDASVQAGRQSGALASFFSTAATAGATMGRILGNVGAALYNVFKIGGGSTGAQMLSTIEGMSAQFRSWTTSADGVKAISDWFKTGRDNLAAMGRLLSSVTDGLSDMGSGKQLGPLIDQITNKVIPPLMEFLHNASASGALSSLVDAVAAIVQVFADLSASDGSLKAFAKTLEALATAAGWIVENVPGASTALGAFFTVAGAAGALKFAGLGGVVTSLGGALSTLASRLMLAAGAETTEAGTLSVNSIARGLSTSTLGTWLGVKALEFAAWARTLPMMLANTAGMIASKVAMIAAAAASKAMAAGQWLLNAAMDANPIGLIVIAIAALVAGFILAYKHSATFRAIVQGALHAVGAAGKWLWNNALQPAFHAIVGGLKAAWAGAQTLARLGSAAFRSLGSMGKWMWNNALQPAFRAILRGVATVIQGWANMARAGGKLPGPLGAVFRRIAGALQGAADKAYALANGLQKIRSPKPVNIWVTTHYATTGNQKGKPLLNGGGAARNARGTDNWRGGLTWVGEEGPELVSLPRGSGVVPNHRVGGMVANAVGGGSQVNNFYVDGSQSPEMTAREIEKKLLTLKRQQGGHLELLDSKR